MRWSEELYRIHGLDPAVPAPSWDKDFLRLYTAESMNTLKPAVEELQKHGTSFELELEAILPDGSHRWLRARGEPVRDAPGTIVAIRGITQDISRLKELERMKEEWTSMIAHDLRQPIGAIKMSAALLPDLHAGSMANDEQIITERIRSGADALSRMVEDLLDVSRLEARGLTLDRAWLDPVTLVQKTLDHMSHATENHVVQVSVDGKRSPVLVDPARFEQVLGNLLSNAVKYGEQHGAIQVGVRQRDKEVEISVTNHGPGILPDEIPRIFVRFARSPTARRAGVTGLGLGLYIAKGLVEAHGGRMWVESVPGKVTTFTFTLPSRGGARAAA